MAIMQARNIRTRPSSTLNDDLIEAWNFNEDEYHGTRYSHRTPGVGPACQFTRANSEQLSVSDGTFFQGTDRDLSACVWFRLDQVGVNQTILGRWEAGNSRREWYIIVDSSNNIQFSVSSDGDGTGVTTVTTLSAGAATGRWYFMAVYHDAASNEIGASLNGATFVTSSHAGGINGSSSNKLRVGVHDSSSNYLDGRAMLAGVWDKVLTQAQVTRLYNEGAGRAFRDLNDDDKTSMVGWWNLNEPSGVRVNNFTPGSDDMADNNSVTAALGVAPSARQFTAANTESFFLADNANFSGSDRAITISCRIYLDSLASNESIVSKWNTGGDEREYLLDVDASGNLDWNVSGDGTAGDTTTVTWGSTLSTGTWYTIEAYHDPDGNVIGIAVDDGTPVTAAHTTGINDSGSNFSVGAETSGNYFDGRIQFIRFWDKLLSAEESKLIHNYGQGLRHSEFTGGLQVSLVASWDGGEKSGNLLDSTGNSLDLTDNLTVTWSAGVDRGLSLGDRGPVPAIGGTVGARALRVSAASDSGLELEHITSHSPGDTDFTITAWVWQSDGVVSDDVIFGKWDESDEEFKLEVTSATPRFIVSDDGITDTTTVTSSTDLTPGTWHFLVAYHDNGTEVGISLDNGPFDTASHTTGVHTDAQHLGLGSRDSGDEAWDGYIGPVTFHRRLLTTAEITRLYNGGDGLTAPYGGSLDDDLQGAWNCDEEGFHGVRWEARRQHGHKCARFLSANSEYLSHADHAGLSGSDKDFSMVGWVYASTYSADMAAFGKWLTTGNQREYALVYDNTADRLRFQVSNDGTAEVTVDADTLGAPVEKRWYFVHVYHDAANDEIGISVNDQTADTTSHSTGLNDGTGAFTIGAIADPADYWNGKIQCVSLWNKVLTAAEQTRMFNAGIARRLKDMIPTDRTKMIAHWDLADESGSRLDGHGAFDLTDNATVLQGIGVVGPNSLGMSGHFNGTNEYLSRADNATLSASDRDFSLACWFYLDSAPSANAFMAAKWGASGQREYRLYVASTGDDQLGFTVTDDGSTDANVLDSEELLTGRWYFGVGYHDATNNLIGVSLNGGAFTTSAHTLGVFDSTSNFTIGASSSGSGSFFPGRVAQVGFWDKVLQSHEVEDLYNNGNGLHFHDYTPELLTSLTAFWPLNEGEKNRRDMVGTLVLTDNNSVNSEVDPAQNAAQFTAANSESLSRADNSVLSGSDRNFSFDGWFYTDSTGVWQGIIGKYLTTGDQREYLLVINTSDELEWHVSSDGTVGNRTTVTWGTSLSTATWYHFHCYHDADNDEIGLLVDNGTAVTASHSGGAHDGTDTFYIGAYGNPGYMDGRIMYVRFWDKVLSADERISLYNWGQGLRHVDMPSFRESLLEDLNASWDLREHSGVRYDSLGVQHLTDNATVTFNGPMDQAMQFCEVDGDAGSQVWDVSSKVGDYAIEVVDGDDLQIPSIAALSPGDTDFTVAFWIYLDELSADNVLGIKDSGATDIEWFFDVTAAGVMQFTVSNDGTATATATESTVGALTLGTWNLVVGYHDNGTGIGISVNDNAFDTTAHTTGVHKGSTAFVVGSVAAGTGLNGRIDSLAIWSKVLSAAEITELYNSGKGKEPRY